MTSGNMTPELLYLLHGDPSELAEALVGMRPADIAEALRELQPDAAAKVMAALPFDLAVQVFDEPELERYRCDIVLRIDPASVGPLIDAMSSDQQADLFRELPDDEGRQRLLKKVEPSTREALKLLLKYPPDTAGGIMTTEFVSIPTNWTVDQALRHIREVGNAKETVYAIYVVEPTDRSLVHVVSLRDLMMADRSLQVGVGRNTRTETVLGDAARGSRGRRASHLQVQPPRRARRR